MENFNKKIKQNRQKKKRNEEEFDFKEKKGKIRSENTKSKNESITQYFYDITKDNRTSQSGGYKQIEEIVSNINLVQKDFERLKKRTEAKGLYKLVLKSYDSVTETIGIKQQYHSDLELFDKQINNVSQLNQILGSLTINGDRELNLLEKRVNSIIRNEEKYYREISKKQNYIKKTGNELDDTKEKFVNLEKSEDNYFEIQREVINLERSLYKEYGELGRSIQNYVGTRRHKDNIIYMEKLFSMYLNTASNIAVITKQIGEALVDNQKVFSECGNLVNVSAAVSSGLDILSDYNKQLNNEFIGGVKTMQDMIYSNSNVRMIEDTNHNLRNLIDDIRAVDYRQDMMTETLIGEK